MAPANNYGGGGALAVSGAAATNALGETNGLFDTLMRFPMTNVVSSEAVGNWLITGVRLILNEMALPDRGP
jgi:hypothetical protein